MSNDDEDFEFHSVLEAVAPAAVRTLIDLSRPESGGSMREEAVRRLRQMQISGLLAGIPLDLRREAEAVLAESD